MVAVLTALVAVLAAPAAVSAAPAHHRPWGPHPTVRNDLSQPVYSYANAIRQSVWVQTGFDSDKNGRPDRVAADIIRPAEPAQAGQKVPVIMDASPYYSCCGRGNESQVKTYDAAGNPVQFPLFYDNYFVPRGYAVVLVDLMGTNRSDGCVDVGGPSDIGSAKAVIDWLNGRATAYTSHTGTTVATASWTDGDVGMIGKSWDATIANGVAATGEPGLKTIVPVSGISSWYDYYFQQGAALQSVGPDWLSNEVESTSARAHCKSVQSAIVSGTPRNGDWTGFWQQRDYADSAADVKASVLLTHGKQDLNVRTKNFGQWWSGLTAAGVERKIWLSQTGHVDPFDFRRGQWVDTLHQWFDHYLLGVDNGIQNQDQGSVERTPDTWADDATWPAPGTQDATLHPRPGATAGLGTLGLTAAPAGSTQSFTDDPAQSEDDWAAQAGQSTSAKTVFTTGVLTSDLRLSGSGTVTVTASSSTTSAHLSAILVDLGPSTIRDYEGPGEGIKTLTTRSCWGDSTSGDSACFLDTAADTTGVSRTIFSRGWADLGHWAGTGAPGVPLTPGQPYTITVQLAATDYVVPAGHRLALIIAGTDAGLLEPPASTPKVTIDLARTSALLPLVGGTVNVPARATAAPATTAAPRHARPERTLRGRLPGGGPRG
jgi:X-Pro dipeptidyl-peptidase